MNSEAINKYVAAQVQAAADRTVLPIVESIKGEVAGQAANNARIVKLTEEVKKLNDESNKRITALQNELVKETAAVQALSVKLGEAVAAAGNTDVAPAA
jgi:hypothetical protein